VELIGARVSRLFALALDKRPEHRHPVRTIRFLDLAVGTDALQKLAVRRQLLHAMVLPVGDEDVAGLVEGDAPRLVELALAFAGFAAFADKLSVRAEHLQAVVAAVDDDDIAALFDRQARRTRQFAVTAAGSTPFADELAVVVEHRD